MRSLYAHIAHKHTHTNLHINNACHQDVCVCALFSDTRIARGARTHRNANSMLVVLLCRVVY